MNSLDKQTATVKFDAVPAQRVPVHGWNAAGIIVYTAQQQSERKFSIIPWHRVELIDVELMDEESFVSDYTTFLF